MPKAGPATRHIRDIEALTSDDLPLRKHCSIYLILYSPTSLKNHRHPKKRANASTVNKLDEVKELLLNKHYPNVLRSSIHCGYHRGRRHLVGPIFWPDIVSVHHLHLHVIVEPKAVLKFFKYPAWFRYMWISDKKVMAEMVKRRRLRMGGKGKRE